MQEHDAERASAENGLQESGLQESKTRKRLSRVLNNREAEESPQSQIAHGPASSNSSEKKRATRGNITHYTGEELNRSPYFPKKYLSILLIFVIAGAVIGAIIFYEYYDLSIGKATRNEAKMNSVLSETVDYDMPSLSSAVEYGGNITAFCDDQGYAYVKLDSSGSNESALFKYPESMDSILCLELLQKDTNKLSAADAVQLFYGSWQLDSDVSSQPTIHLMYYDFKSNTIEAAIEKCLYDQGFNESEAKEQGVDEVGNTYKMGYETIGDDSYEWRVSAIPADKVYNVKFPENTFIIGFRLTERA